MPKATSVKKEANVSFDQEIINAVVKQVLTPEKIATLAAKMAPAIEKQFTKSVTIFVENLFEDNWRLADMLQDDKVIRDALLVGLRKAVGVDPKVATMIKAKDSKSKRAAKAYGTWNAGGAVLAEAPERW